MSDSPKLLLEKYDPFRFEEYLTEPSVSEVVDWLREQGVGEEVEAEGCGLRHRCGRTVLEMFHLPAGRYLLVRVPEKASNE